MSDGQLSGHVVAVTGGGSGFGAALCRAFGAAGASIAVLDIDEAGAKATATSLTDDGGVPAVAVGVDVGDAGSVLAAAAAVGDAFGGCDVLCSNVGVQQFGAIDRLTDDDWSWVLDVNVLGTVRTVAAFLPMLRASAGTRRIALTCSSSALVPGVRLGAYQTSKFAVMGYGETLRQELEPEGIGVTIVFPGGMMTRHLESSAAARPAAIGEWVLQSDDIEAMLAGSDVGGEVATPEHAARNVVADVLAGEPYVVTHGDFRAGFHRRVAALDAALERALDS